MLLSSRIVPVNLQIHLIAALGASGLLDVPDQRRATTPAAEQAVHVKFVEL